MNWGNKLLLTFIVFASGMGYLVYRSMHVNFELVEKDYYKSELRYQEVIDGTNQVNQLSSAVKLEQNEKGILLQLPEEMKGKSISGDIWFYCAYDERKDKKAVLHVTASATQQFDSTAILSGQYTVKINWSCGGKNYFSEKKLIVL
ncbi:MAG: FixH family protein [Bacteroidota bacterium]